MRTFYSSGLQGGRFLHKQATPQSLGPLGLVKQEDLVFIYFGGGALLDLTYSASIS